MNPMQKYLHIIELSDCVLNMFFYVFMLSKCLSFFRNLFKSKTIETKNFIAFKK